MPPLKPAAARCAVEHAKACRQECCLGSRGSVGDGGARSVDVAHAMAQRAKQREEKKQAQIKTLFSDASSNARRALSMVEKHEEQGMFLGDKKK